MQKEFVLSNGVVIPAVGYGSFQATVEDGEETILRALEAGYRYIDTASFYNNEDDIGRAIEKSDIGRENLFLCSKVWPSDLGKEWTLKSFEESCSKLKTDYLDMFLIHWPKEDPEDPDSKYTVKECESFFRSRYFATLADVDPEMMMRRLAEV